MKTINLKYPFDWDGKTISQIELKRPKMKHIKHLGESPTTDDLIKVAAKVSGQLPIVFDEMDALDGIAVCEAVADFLADAQPTGQA